MKIADQNTAKFIMNGSKVILKYDDGSPIKIQ